MEAWEKLHESARRGGRGLWEGRAWISRAKFDRLTAGMSDEDRGRWRQLVYFYDDDLPRWLNVDLDKAAAEFLRLAGQAPPPRGLLPLTRDRHVRWFDGEYYILDETYAFERQTWDRVLEACAKQNGKTERLRADTDAWAADYERLHGVAPNVVRVSADSCPAAEQGNPLDDLRKFLDWMESNLSFFDDLYRREVEEQMRWERHMLRRWYSSEIRFPGTYRGGVS